MLEPQFAYQALLIDLDGVIRIWADEDHRIEDAHNLPRGAIARAAFAPDLLERVITGQLGDGAWRGEIARSLAQQFANASAVDAVNAWSTSCGTINESVMATLRQVRARIKMVLVTNATDRLMSDLNALDLIGQFDAIINSSDVGFAKPSRAIFDAALREIGVRAEQAIFVDDQIANIEAASSLGICSHRFVDASTLASFLRRGFNFIEFVEKLSASNAN
jgi:HAD superfamily hydrolase (TIGR01509 family)